MYPVELVGARIVVREVRDGDFDGIRVYAQDPEVHRFLIWQRDSAEDTRRWMEDVQAHARREHRSVYELAIAERGTDLAIGGIRLGIESFADRSAGIGYVLRRDRWGRGIATEAARLVVGFGFDVLGLHRIAAMCAPENVASARVLEKVGMTREGHLRERHLVKSAWRDAYLYAILDRDPR